MKKLAIIVPYRDRQEHLKEFLKVLPSKINEGRGPLEHIPYQIVIVEQGNDKPFNRGKLLNVGFQLIKDECDYVCFHDVDMMPVTADYSYVYIPTHLAAHIAEYKDWVGKGLAYETFFGAVCLFTNEDFITINGYSNLYWGYGAEDDNLFCRIQRNHLPWERRTGRYNNLPHEKSNDSPEHHVNKERLIKFIKGIEKDETGLSDLHFTILEKKQKQNYIFYSVDI